MDDQHLLLPLRRLDHHLDRGSLMTPRIDIARSDIEQVVHAFYARARAHPVLAQVFSRHVDDWSAHEEKITRFWANALLFEGDYDGNPMQAHMQAQTVKPVHFDHWLSLFDDTLFAELPSQPAIQWSQLAHRIGRGLSMVIEDVRRPRDQAPKLRQASQV